MQQNDSIEISNQPLQILLVEHDPETISAVQGLFSDIKESELSIVSSANEALMSLMAWQPDLLLFSHQPTQDDDLQFLNEVHKKCSSIYAIVSLPTADEKLVTNYIKEGANGFAFKDKNYIPSLTAAVKKALIRIVEKKSFLLNSLSSSGIFAADDDTSGILQLSALASGESVLHYRVLKEIGEGGMGEIYLAEDLKLGRPVAIKILPSRVTRNDTARKRLIREARAASALSHPNIVTIYAIEDMDDMTFIVMEYVKGASLSHLVQKGPIDFLRLMGIAEQIGDALTTAHRIGLIHRDIKPANIMIADNDKVKLLDFGLAKWVLSLGKENTDMNLTGVGVPIGTVTYMSPEQTRGEELDARTDVFSFGCVLYEAATGKPPFQGASALAVMHAIATADPEPPSKINATLPQYFDLILEKALAKDRQDRYGSMAELADALLNLKATLTHDVPDPALEAALVRSLIEPEREQRARNVVRKTDESAAKSKVRIFLVEDNDDNRDMLSRRLQRKGFHVQIAVNGQEAVDKIPVELPDLILMDISLPIMDGFEAIRRLKADQRTKKIPIIALTAHAMPGDREKVMAARCDDYDTKPVDFERLLTKINQWLTAGQKD